MSDHEAVKLQLSLSVKRLLGNYYRKAYQYHKANQIGVKEEIERYKQEFLSHSCITILLNNYVMQLHTHKVVVK